MDISKVEYENNLLFYTILKKLIKCHLSENKMILNEEKLNNIMQRHGYYVVVAQEIYDSKQYFKKNGRVISSKNFNKESLKKLFNKFI